MINDRLHLKITLSVKTDLTALWGKIGEIKGVHLSGSSGDYIVYFDGKHQDGLEVLMHCLNASNVGKIFGDYGE